MLQVKFDFDVERLPNEKLKKALTKESGVYLIYDTNNNPLYVGQTNMLTYRLMSHFKGNSNLKRYAGIMNRFSVIYESDETLRLLAERYLIINLKPSLNVNKWSVKSGVNTDSIQGVFCNGTTLSGNKCRLIAHSNGYCRHHGGNGETMTNYIKQASEIALKEYAESQEKKFGNKQP